MRISDLLESEVVDRSGRRLGWVHDALLVQDGPQQAPGDAAFRLHGLVCGRAAFGTRLGYERGQSGGPALLQWVFRSLERNARYVDWHAIGAIEARRIVLSVEAREVPRLREVLARALR